jgi:hypothetical protein
MPSLRDYQRWARKGKTSARGYHSRHQAERERRLLRYRPGDVCAHGGELLMYPLPIQVKGRYGTRLVSPWLDLPHTDDRTGYLPGLSCRRHNRGDGARRGNRARGVRTWQSSRAW